MQEVASKQWLCDLGSVEAAYAYLQAGTFQNDPAYREFDEEVAGYLETARPILVYYHRFDAALQGGPAVEFQYLDALPARLSLPAELTE